MLACPFWWKFYSFVPNVLRIVTSGIEGSRIQTNRKGRSKNILVIFFFLDRWFHQNKRSLHRALHLLFLSTREVKTLCLSSLRNLWEQGLSLVTFVFSAVICESVTGLEVSGNPLSLPSDFFLLWMLFQMCFPFYLVLAPSSTVSSLPLKVSLLSKDFLQLDGGMCL